MRSRYRSQIRVTGYSVCAGISSCRLALPIR
jgi:hypothetical protein